MAVVDARRSGMSPPRVLSATVAAGALLATLWAMAPALEPAAEQVARARFTVQLAPDGEAMLVDGVSAARHRLFMRFAPAIRERIGDDAPPGRPPAERRP